MVQLRGGCGGEDSEDGALGACLGTCVRFGGSGFRPGLRFSAGTQNRRKPRLARNCQTLVWFLWNALGRTLPRGRLSVREPSRPCWHVYQKEINYRIKKSNYVIKNKSIN